MRACQHIDPGEWCVLCVRPRFFQLDGIEQAKIRKAAETPWPGEEQVEPLPPMAWEPPRGPVQWWKSGWWQEPLDEWPARFAELAAESLRDMRARAAQAAAAFEAHSDTTRT